MSVPDWLKSLFSKKGDEVKQINALSERRALLAQRRDRMYEDIAKLEGKEAGLVEEGRNNASQVVRRRLAAQVTQLRHDISRMNTTASMLNQQLNIISTHIHNLTLIQQGEAAQLPAAEDLAQDAVRAEELLESLRADGELVSGLETGTAAAMMSAEEAAVIAEFEKVDEAKAAGAVSTPMTREEKAVMAEFDSPSRAGGKAPPARQANPPERAGPASE